MNTYVAKKESTADTRALMEGEHERWQSHPITKELCRILQRESERLVDWLAANATNNDIDNVSIRLATVKLKQTKQTLRLLNETNHFIDESKR